MAPVAPSEMVRTALNSLLTDLPPTTVSLVWLEQALARIHRDLLDRSLIESNILLDHTGNIDAISLIDLSVDEARITGDLPAHLPVLNEERYVPSVTLGSGGQGIVREAIDTLLGRKVALKTLRVDALANPNAVRSFLREARITGQLNHAGIVPIYDVGKTAENLPCYTMRRIGGRSLRDILIDIRQLHAHSSSPAPREFPRRRLLEILVAVAHTVGYAHDRGVIHRDLKPGNIMIGAYGEVLVLDWGIARVLGEADEAAGEEAVTEGGLSSATVAGTIKGTPGYMAPEQAYGDTDAQGTWTDMYALGLILYEILLGFPARRPGSSEDALEAARTLSIDSPEARRRREGIHAPPIPDELERICMKCIERDPKNRFDRGEALARALEAYLDGEERRELAECRAKDAEARMAMLRGMEDEISGKRAEARLLAEAVEPWINIERKRVVWAREDDVKAAEGRRDQTKLEAFALFTQALGDDPDNRRARAGLARLYFDQLIEAELWGRWMDARRFEAQVKSLDDGQLRDALRGDGILRLETEPPNAEAWLYDLVERDRRLQPVVPRLLGHTPLEITLPRRGYLVRIMGFGSADGIDVAYPIQVRRLSEWNGKIHLHRSIPEGFIYIPAGTFFFGGDRQAPGSGPREERFVDDFVIAKFPVTCAQYLEFLNALHSNEPYKAIRHAPRPSGAGSKDPLWPRDLLRGFRIPQVDVFGGRWSPDMAVRCVSRDDSHAYCDWRSSLHQIPFRIPSEFEWEKAGRGVDARWFPWGNEFDASFCKMKDSRPGSPEPESVGAFPLDCSPYGVMDLAGGVIEWCSGPFDRHAVLGIQKGGFWMASQANCRLARRFGVFPTEPEPFAGFRLAYSPASSPSQPVQHALRLLAQP